MLLRLSELYEKIVLQRPVLTLLAVALFVAFFSIYVPDFRLDASGDSLVLENDEDLRYYRSIQARYGTDDYVLATYTPDDDLFSKGSLSKLMELRDDLVNIKGIESVVSILDVPLIQSPPISLAEVTYGVRSLEDPETNVSLAKNELLSSPLYRNLIISPDGNTTALQVNFKRDESLYAFFGRRDELREKVLVEELTKEESNELVKISIAFKDRSADLIEQKSGYIAQIRAVLDKYRGNAKLYLGGLPMITSDMIDFIRHDLAVFGLGVLFFLIVMLELFFHKARWVVISMICCFVSVLFMFGYLGFIGWRVTVVSSNFTSLLLIITLSLTVHLIVRYHELYTENKAENKCMSQICLISDTMKSKAVPSLYTALTTIVAFGSLLVSGIRPVIDFGWMMSIGICAAFIISFVIFPASLMLLKPKSTP